MPRRHKGNDSPAETNPSEVEGPPTRRETDKSGPFHPWWSYPHATPAFNALMAGVDSGDVPRVVRVMIATQDREVKEAITHEVKEVPAVIDKVYRVERYADVMGFVARFDPHVLIVDPNMLVLPEIELSKIRFPRTKILAWVSHEPQASDERLAGFGIDGLIDGSLSSDRIRKEILTAAVASARMRANQEDRWLVDSLTSQERRVGSLITELQASLVPTAAREVPTTPGLQWSVEDRLELDALHTRLVNRSEDRAQERAARLERSAELPIDPDPDEPMLS